MDSLRTTGRIERSSLKNHPINTIAIMQGRALIPSADGGQRSFAMGVPVQIEVNYTDFLNYQYAILGSMYGGLSGENFYIQMPGPFNH